MEEEQDFPSRSERHKKEKAEKASKADDLVNKVESTAAIAKDWIKKPMRLAASEKHSKKDNTAGQTEKTEGKKAEPKTSKIIVQSNTSNTSSVSNTSNGPSEPDEKVIVERHKTRRKLTPAAGFLLLLVMLVSGVFCGHAAMKAILPSVDEYYANNTEQEMQDNVNILVLGCDEREGENVARADVIIVATLRTNANEASMFSIPRDTRVAIEGYGRDKINHAMSYGGIPLVKSSVENLLGIEIDHCVKVNFDGFINVIDALGGVDVEVAERMYKPLEAIDLMPGYQTLNGADALAFVRWRGDGTGDYGRIERQQQFVTALTDKVKNMSVSQALDVANAVMDSIETDMTIRQMTSYGMDVLDMGTEGIKTYSFVGETLWIHGVNYVEPDMAAIADIVDKMQHGEPEVASEADAAQTQQ